MKDYYFVVFELPGSEELRFENGKYLPGNFWKTAAESIDSGRAKIVCRRRDTGICEEIRQHSAGNTKFTTYVLANILLRNKELINDEAITKKALKGIIDNGNEYVIEQTENFQVVVIEA